MMARDNCAATIATALCCVAAAMGVVVLSGAAARAGEIRVPKDLPTIQAAVDVASPGDTIRVQRGIYEEQIIIDKNLTLKGAGAGVTVIQAPPVMVPFARHLAIGIDINAIVEVTDGARVTMSGLTVTGPVPCAVSTTGVAVIRNATLEIKESHITRMRPEGGTCAPADAFARAVGVGVAPYIQLNGAAEGGSVGHATVTEMLIDKYHSVGISVAASPGGPPSTATIEDNVIVGGSDIPVDGGQIGIYLTWAVAEVTDNTVRGNVCTGAQCGTDPINSFQAVGILAPFFPSAETEISDNTVSDNDVGIYEAGTVEYVIRDNVVRNNRLFGIVIQDGTAATADNTISGGRVGIAVVAGTADAVGYLRDDRIRRTTVAPIQELECCGFTATAKVGDRRRTQTSRAPVAGRSELDAALGREQGLRKERPTAN